jgi:uncharacterized protein YdaU (DUF1376 family)
VNPPKMPIHIGDYMRDTGHLRATEHGAYLLLMFHYWSTGSLPDNDDHLAAIARLSRAEWNKHKATLQSFFKDEWKHGRIDFELEKARSISQAAREAGKASGRSRSAKQTLNGRSSSVEPTLEPLNHKKDAASAASVDQETDLFKRGKEVLGKNAGGLIKQLLTAKGGKITDARAAIETAAGKHDPREYIGGVIRKKNSDDGPQWLDGIPGVI